MNMKQISLILLTALMLFTNLSSARADTTFSMSLTIPAIPGLNVPPYENEAANAQPAAAESQEIQAAGNETANTAQQNAPEQLEQNLESGESSVLKTYYSR